MLYKTLKIQLLLLFLAAFAFFQCVPSPPRYTNRPYPEHQLQSIRMNAAMRERFLAEIQRFYGAPYQWGGTSPSGTDCSGMVYTIYQNAAGITLPRNSHQMYKTVRPIAKRSLQFGDLIFFSRNGTRVHHMGLYIQNGYFLHASSSRGVTLDHLNENPYQPQFIGAGRVDFN